MLLHVPGVDHRDDAVEPAEGLDRLVGVRLGDRVRVGLRVRVGRRSGSGLGSWLELGLDRLICEKGLRDLIRVRVGVKIRVRVRVSGQG